MLATACASAPKPAVPDGGARVPINDPARVTLFQQQTAAEMAAVNAQIALQGELASLRKQVEDLRGVVRVALLMPASAPVTPVAVAPARPAPPQPETKSNTLASIGIAVTELPAHTVDRVAEGVVVRKFHEVNHVEFQLQKDLAAALRSSARDADSIVIRGYTDSAVADGANQRVAAGRAASAKRWLVANGIDPARIQTRYKGGGSFLADNNTDSGRALNRRVEVELRGAGDAAVTALQMKGSQP